MRLADSHAHFFRTGFVRGRNEPVDSEIRQYEALRRQHDISHVLAVGYETCAFSANNWYLAQLVSTRSWLVPLAYCNTGRAPSLHRLARWRQQRFRGITLYVRNADAASRLTQWPREVCAELRQERALVSINAPIAVWRELPRFLAQLDGCIVLVSHLGLPGIVADDISYLAVKQRMQPLSLLVDFAGIVVKASGFYACGLDKHEYPHRGSEKIFRWLAETFGIYRLCWGSDYSPALLHVSFRQAIGMLDHLALTPHEKSLVGGGNLRRILNSQA